jgi:membrane protein YdbS with pleckstrin-like domain
VSAAPESIWALKPWWCQPWSILLTGVGIVAASWWWLQRWWITGPVALLVLLWWLLFLVLVPASYREQREQDSQEA